MLPWRAFPQRFLSLVTAICMLSGTACADWVWTPERGWHNPKTEVRGSADQLFTKGTRLFQGQKYKEAAEVFTSLSKGYPGSQFAKRAEFFAGESYFEGGRLFDAYESYEAYLRDYPESGEIEVIVEKEYEIGRAYLNGARKARFGIPFLSLPSPKTGIRILESVIEHSPYSDYADDSLYAIADYYFRQETYDKAAGAYRRLAREYPESEWSTKSKYQAAVCAERSFTGGAYSVESLVDARKQLEEYRAQHPETVSGPSVRGQIAAIDESLAQKMWNEVKFYGRVGKLHSAGYMCRRLEARYPDSRYAAMAAQWVGEHPEVLVDDEADIDEAAAVLAPSLRGVSPGDGPTPPPPAGTAPAPLPVPAPAPAATPVPAAPGDRFVPRSHATPGSKQST